MPTPMEEALAHIQSRGDGGSNLGGSTGARLHDTPYGKYVGKRGAHPQHILNEFDINRYLNSVGVGVPNAGLYNDAGSPLMLTEFEEDARRIDPSRDKAKIQQDIAPQALVGNWDVTGMFNDNALVRPDGDVSYVDVGGAGAYRAMGAPKNNAFGPIVDEHNTLRNRNDWYKGMTDQQVGQSWDRHGGEDAFTEALQYLQNPQTQQIMGDRVQDFARQVA